MSTACAVVKRSTRRPHPSSFCPSPSPPPPTALAANEFTSSDWSQPFNATAGPNPTLGEMVLSIRWAGWYLVPAVSWRKGTSS